MRVVGLLSWFDEPPAQLAATVASAAGCCDHLVALDGPYKLYPHASMRPMSPSVQAMTIICAARACGLGLTVEHRAVPWAGGEVEKRSHLFRLGLAVAEPMVDWFFVIDGDERLDTVPADLHQRLERSGRHVATVTLRDRDANVQNRAHRALFRAVPDLEVVGAHYINICELDGEQVVLRGLERLHQLAPAEDLSEVVVEHDQQSRPAARAAAGRSYYQRRDELVAERVATTFMRGLDGEPVRV